MEKEMVIVKLGGSLITDKSSNTPKINDLNLDPQDFKVLYQKAIEEEDFSADLYKWTKIINDNYDEETKLNIYRLACKIITIDGKIDPFESNFTRRLSGLLYLTDKQAGEIRKEFNS